MDPLSEKYYSISPYVYVMNNPMKFVDPTGMVIDSLSQGSWNDQKGIITALRDLLIDKNKNGKNDERITSLNSTLNDMTSLENSDDVYSLAATNGDIGYLKYDVSTGKLVIEYNGTSNFVHELTHGGQFERGELGFDKQSGASIGQDLWDEASAYQAQFNYDPSSVGYIRKAENITPKWVQNITDTNGNKIYAPGGSSNTGSYPLNGNSRGYDIIMAYPALRNQIIPVLINLAPLRAYPNNKFK